MLPLQYQRRPDRHDRCPLAPFSTLQYALCRFTSASLCLCGKSCGSVGAANQPSTAGIPILAAAPTAHRGTTRRFFGNFSSYNILSSVLKPDFQEEQLSSAINPFSFVAGSSRALWAAAVLAAFAILATAIQRPEFCHACLREVRCNVAQACRCRCRTLRARKDDRQPATRPSPWKSSAIISALPAAIFMRRRCDR